MGWGPWQLFKGEIPSANAVILPVPHPQEVPNRAKWEDRAAAPLVGPGDTCQGKGSREVGTLTTPHLYEPRRNPASAAFENPAYNHYTA